MTTHEALCILSLAAPINREELRLAYERLSRGKDRAQAGRLYEAYACLSMLGDHEHPYQPVAGLVAEAGTEGGAATSASISQAGVEEPRLPRAATPRPAHMASTLRQAAAPAWSQYPQAAVPASLPPPQQPVVSLPVSEESPARRALPPLPVAQIRPEAPAQHESPFWQEAAPGAAPLEVEAQMHTEAVFTDAYATGDATAMQGAPLALLEEGPAPLLHRAGASVIDAMLLIHWFLIPTGLAEAALRVCQQGTGAAAGDVFCFLFALISVVLYSALLESSRWQATLGKQACQVVIADMAGGRLSFALALRRGVARLLSQLTLGGGYLVCFGNPWQQTLHDRLAKTLALRKLPDPYVPVEQRRTPLSLYLLAAGAVAALVIQIYIGHLSNRVISEPAPAAEQVAPAAPAPALVPAPTPAPPPQPEAGTGTPSPTPAPAPSPVPPQTSGPSPTPGGVPGSGTGGGGDSPSAVPKAPPPPPPNTPTSPSPQPSSPQGPRIVVPFVPAAPKP